MKTTTKKKSYVRALSRYFETVEITTDKGTTLRVESDGRAGNGVTHWRAVYIGDKLVADLEGHQGESHASVTIAPDNNLRSPKCTHHDFHSLQEAVEFLQKTF